MLRWLDGEKNTATAPNENLSREFMELFALGHGDGYTETDVREGARALTGWKIRPDGTTYLNAAQHDNTSKTVLGVTGNLDVTGYCDAVLARPASASYLATRWWGQLVSDTPPAPETVTAIAAAYGNRRDLSAMFSAMFTRPEFGAAEGSLVIDPVEWLIGATRALRVPGRRRHRRQEAARRAARARPGAVLPAQRQRLAVRAGLAVHRRRRRSDAGRASRWHKAGDLSPRHEVRPAPSASTPSVTCWASAPGRRVSAAVLRDAVADPQRLVAVALNTPEYLVH